MHVVSRVLHSIRFAQNSKEAYSFIILKFSLGSSGKSLSESEESGLEKLAPTSARVTDILFDLSSEVRLKQLFTISKKKIRMAELARETDATIQETSRHLARLRNEKFIEKNSEGFFEITTFGRMLIQSTLRSAAVLSKHRDYFLTHDMNQLPPEYLQRIVALTESEFDGMAGLVQRRYEKMLTETREYLWIMGDNVTISGERIGQSLNKGVVSLRILFPTHGLGTPLKPKEELNDIRKSFRGSLEVRSIERTVVGLVINEMESRFVGPDLSGRLDYNNAFGGKDSLFHSWCFELFSHYWNRADKVISYEGVQKLS